MKWWSQVDNCRHTDGIWESSRGARKRNQLWRNRTWKPSLGWAEICSPETQRRESRHFQLLQSILRSSPSSPHHKNQTPWPSSHPKISKFSTRTLYRNAGTRQESFSNSPFQDIPKKSKTETMATLRTKLNKCQYIRTKLLNRPHLRWASRWDNAGRTQGNIHWSTKYGMQFLCYNSCRNPGRWTRQW